MNGGLGICYLDKMGDYHAQSMNFNSVYADGKRSRMPRYYLNKLSLSDSVSSLELATFKASRIERIQTEQYAKYAQKFKEFCQDHKGLSYNEMCAQFNAKLRHGEAARDELIIKHCKKQKL